MLQDREAIEYAWGSVYLLGENTASPLFGNQSSPAYVACET